MELIHVLYFSTLTLFFGTARHTGRAAEEGGFHMVKKQEIGAWIPDKETLVFIGSEKLKSIKATLTSRAKQLNESLEKAQSLVDALDGKTIEDIKAIAAGYEHPEFPGAGREPGPDDIASIRRKAGATTFNFCGWCNHHDGGWYYYKGYSKTSCCFEPEKFIPEELNENRAFNRYFNTPCVIANGTQELLESCLAKVKADLEEFAREKAIIDKNMEIVDDAITQAERKPCFAGWRQSAWFQGEDDEVVCFVSKSTPDAIKTGIFVTGPIVDSYFGESVTVCTDKQVRTDKDALRGYGLDFGLKRPEVMQRWEYEYLKTHPEFRRMWIKENVGLDKWDPDEMNAAFECTTL